MNFFPFEKNYNNVEIPYKTYQSSLRGSLFLRYSQPFKRQPHKMVKNTQTIHRQKHSFDNFVKLVRKGLMHNGYITVSASCFSYQTANLNEESTNYGLSCEFCSSKH